jgi:glutaredoxin
MKIDVYSKIDCPYCVKAKDLLKSHGLSYREFIISAGMGEKPLMENQQYITRTDFLENNPGAKTVPQVWIDGVLIGGYDKLSAHFKNINT